VKPVAVHWNKSNVTKHTDANSDCQVRFKLITKRILNEELAISGGVGKPSGGFFVFLAFSKQK